MLEVMMTFQALSVFLFDAFFTIQPIALGQIIVPRHPHLDWL